MADREDSVRDLKEALAKERLTVAGARDGAVVELEVVERHEDRAGMGRAAYPVLSVRLRAGEYSTLLRARYNQADVEAFHLRRWHTVAGRIAHQTAEWIGRYSDQLADIRTGRQVPPTDHDAQVPAGVPATRMGDGHAWLLQTRVNPMTDLPTVVASRDADSGLSLSDQEGPPLLGEIVRPRLILRCKDGKEDLLLDLKTMAMSRGDVMWPEVKILLRFDKTPAEEFRATIATDLHAVFFQDSDREALVKRMLGHRTLLLEFLSSNPRQTSFGLDGLDEVVGTVRKACTPDRADAGVR